MHIHIYTYIYIYIYEKIMFFVCLLCSVIDSLSFLELSKDLTEKEEQLRLHVRNICETRVAPIAAEMWERGEFDRRLIDACKAIGPAGLQIKGYGQICCCCCCCCCCETSSSSTSSSSSSSSGSSSSKTTLLVANANAQFCLLPLKIHRHKFIVPLIIILLLLLLLLMLLLLMLLLLLLLCLLLLLLLVFLLGVLFFFTPSHKR